MTGTLLIDIRPPNDTVKTMAKQTGIAWTDSTFNPWWGCTKVSPGCDNCYANALDKRFGGDHWGVGKDRRRTGQKNWNQPIKWNREAEASGTRSRVFCASMADVFDNEIPEEWRADLFNLIRETPHLDWILLTKRIGNVAKMLPKDWDDGWPNVWLLISVVNQEEVDRDCPKLRNTPAAVRGLSVEPQSGPIDFAATSRDDLPAYHWETELESLNWIICGAESGPGRRLFNLDWARTLRDQCQALDVPFFLKQIPGDTHKGVIETPELDGRQWVEFPQSVRPPIREEEDNANANN